MLGERYGDTSRAIRTGSDHPDRAERVDTRSRRSLVVQATVAERGAPIMMRWAREELRRWTVHRPSGSRSATDKEEASPSVSESGPTQRPKLAVTGSTTSGAQDPSAARSPITGWSPAC